MSPTIMDDKSSIGVLEELTSSDYYWNQNAHFRNQEEVLKDKTPKTTMRNVILRNSHLFKDKVVFVVAAGTGYYAMLAAKSGAKTVYAHENSTLARLTKSIITLNGYDEKVKVLDVPLREVKIEGKVDIIISEWVGYCVLQDSKIMDTMFVRDNFLVQNGLIFPDKAYLMGQAIEDSVYKRNKIDWWNQVYGYSMTNMCDVALKEPLTDTVDTANVLSQPHTLGVFNMKTLTMEDFDVEYPLRFQISKRDTCHAFILYFTVEFSDAHSIYYYNCGPEGSYTRWKQTIFYLEQELRVQQRDVIKGVLHIKNKDTRLLDFDFTWKYQIYQGTKAVGTPSEQTYVLAAWTKEKSSNEKEKQTIDAL